MSNEQDDMVYADTFRLEQDSRSNTIVNKEKQQISKKHRERKLKAQKRALAAAETPTCMESTYNWFKRYYAVIILAFLVCSGLIILVAVLLGNQKAPQTTTFQPTPTSTPAAISALPVTFKSTNLLSMDNNIVNFNSIATMVISFNITLYGYSDTTQRNSIMWIGRSEKANDVIFELYFNTTNNNLLCMVSPAYGRVPTSSSNPQGIIVYLVNSMSLGVMTQVVIKFFSAGYISFKNGENLPFNVIFGYEWFLFGINNQTGSVLPNATMSYLRITG